MSKKSESEKLMSDLEPIPLDDTTAIDWEDEGGAIHPDNEFDEALRDYWAGRSLRRRTFKKGGRTYIDSLNPHHDHKGWFYNMYDNKLYRYNDLMELLAKKKQTDLWYGVDEEDIEDEL